MSRLDDIAPGFIAAVNRWPDAPNLRSHYDDLAETYDADGSSVIELCKSFIEMVCITILEETGNAVPVNAQTTEYLGAALRAIGLSNSRGVDVFDKVLSTHNKLSDALSNVRNNHGSVAHGRDGFIDRLTEHHKRMYVLGADTILSLLNSAYEGVIPSLRDTREPHGRFSHLNDRIDGGTAIAATVDEDGTLVVTLRAGSLSDGFDLRVQASKLLYYLDRQAYLDVLDALHGVAFDADVQGGEDDEDDKVEGDEKPAIASPPHVSHGHRVVTKTITYDGRFRDKLTPFATELASVLSAVTGSQDVADQLAATILAGMDELAVVDWADRESTTAAVKLLVKRSLRVFELGIESDGSKTHRILQWLKDNVAGDAQ